MYVSIYDFSKARHMWMLEPFQLQAVSSMQGSSASFMTWFVSAETSHAEKKQRQRHGRCLARPGLLRMYVQVCEERRRRDVIHGAVSARGGGGMEMMDELGRVCVCVRTWPGQIEGEREEEGVDSFIHSFTHSFHPKILSAHGPSGRGVGREPRISSASQPS
jgi:hypothetical protein